MSRCILVLGGSSTIGRAILLRLVRPDDRIFLAGRDMEDLSHVASDLTARSAAIVETVWFDALDPQSQTELANLVRQRDGVPDLILAACGALGDQTVAANSVAEGTEVAASNYLGIANVLANFAHELSARQSGQIIVLSSVAGDRGRASNYPYGAAKAGMNAYLQGLRNRLHPDGVHVMTAKLGFVDTGMIFDKEGVFLSASPQRAARLVAKAAARRRDVVYVPGFWRFIMLAIRLTPEFVFKRLNL